VVTVYTDEKPEYPRSNRSGDGSHKKNIDGDGYKGKRSSSEGNPRKSKRSYDSKKGYSDYGSNRKKGKGGKTRDRGR